jgi:AraC-like DNA-binding protein
MDAALAPVFYYVPPSPALRDYVRQYRIVGCLFPAGVPLPVKNYWPRPENCLSFCPRDPERLAYGLDGQPPVASPRSQLYGQHVVATTRYVGRDFLIFQVVFQPGVLHRLTGIPAGELANTMVDAEAVLGAEIRQVNEQLANTSSALEMVNVVERYLSRLMCRAPSKASLLARVGQLILQRPAQVSVDWLAGQACLSPRQFQRQFVAQHGIGPKLFARVARFDHAMRLRNAMPQHDWLTVALHAGYHDYQHLVRDFSQFTTLTPNAFWLRERQAPERAFGQAEV